MPFDMPPSPAPWDKRGGWVVLALMPIFTLSIEQAAGLVGNLGYESAGFTKLHEGGQPENHGGYGWAQWTADRRVNFFNWCIDQKLSQASDQANFGFLVHELQTTHAKTITALHKCKTIGEAVFSVGLTYERPRGTTESFLPAYNGRLSWANRALSGAKIINASKPPMTDPDDRSIMIDLDLLADEVRIIQRTVNVNPDGILGQVTIAAIQDAQKRKS